MLAVYVRLRAEGEHALALNGYGAVFDKIFLPVNNHIQGVAVVDVRVMEGQRAAVRTARGRINHGPVIGALDIDGHIRRLRFRAVFVRGHDSEGFRNLLAFGKPVGPLAVQGVDVPALGIKSDRAVPGGQGPAVRAHGPAVGLLLIRQGKAVGRLVSIVRVHIHGNNLSGERRVGRALNEGFGNAVAENGMRGINIRGGVRALDVDDDFPAAGQIVVVGDRDAKPDLIQFSGL